MLFLLADPVEGNAPHRSLISRRSSASLPIVLDEEEEEEEGEGESGREGKADESNQSKKSKFDGQRIQYALCGGIIVI